MRYIDYLSEKITIFDNNGAIEKYDFRIYELFLIESYAKDLNLSQEKLFIDNLNSYIGRWAMPEYMSVNDLPEDDYLKIEKYYGRGIYKDMRSAFSEVCCMCGGFGPSQLDHILDKKFHRSYYSFIRNLAPVCACNQAKKASDKTRGTLHPYIDTILKKRIVKFSYEKNTNGDLISIKVVPTEEFISVKAVVSHIENVFVGANLKRAIQVAKLRFDEIKKISATGKDVRNTCISKFIENKSRYKTPNNWYSMSFIGIMDYYGIPYQEIDFVC